VLLIVTLTALVAVAAAAIYLGRERAGVPGLGLAGLRAVALGALLLALFNPVSTDRVTGGPPTVLLDASLSMQASGGHWRTALDTALALVRGGGTLLRFGANVTPADTMLPDDGASRLAEALRAAVGRPGPVVVVTDGEVDDIGGIPPSLLQGVTTLVLPRDTMRNAALLDIEGRESVLQGDTIGVDAFIGSWGGFASGDSATLDVFIGQQRVRGERISLPASPGTARRRITLPTSSMSAGTHVLRFVLTAPGDDEPGDDERLRAITVSTQPAIVVVVDPADTEGRFLSRELSNVARGGVRGYARIGQDRWVDMETLRQVNGSTVQSAARSAALVVVRGDATVAGANARWHWPAASDPSAEFFDGDWYVTPELPSSPFAGRFASVPWDSLPPLTGIIPVVASGRQWVALTGRLGRRGADRPLLIGDDSLGTRRLLTAASGWWRWALRGGVSLEAYRALIAAGTDWLLESGVHRSDRVLDVSAVVPRGMPTRFSWVGGEGQPDSLTIVLAASDTTIPTTLRFDAAGVALTSLPPGVYRWSSPEVRGVNGITIVEPYSDEFHLRPVTLTDSPGTGGFSLVVRHAREKWWLYVLAVLALIAEWAWRQRRGLA